MEDMTGEGQNMDLSLLMPLQASGVLFPTKLFMYVCMHPHGRHDDNVGKCWLVPACCPTGLLNLSAVTPLREVKGAQTLGSFLYSRCKPRFLVSCWGVVCSTLLQSDVTIGKCTKGLRVLACRREGLDSFDLPLLHKMP